jgi:fucose 4-O-acetylase-like acetyltransferase
MQQTPSSTGSAPAASLPQPFADSPHFVWVDVAKGFGIILVVFEHVVRGLISANLMAWTPVTRFVDSWIYAFHMPLFFFLSGLFLFRSKQKPWPDFVSDKLRTLAYPYFVWSGITLGLKTLLGPAVNHPYGISDFPRVFYDPIDQYWFLYALFTLLVVGSVLFKFGVRPWVILASAILIYPGVLPVSSDEIATVDEIRTMAFYVACGVMLGGERNLQLAANGSIRLLVFGIAAGTIVSLLAGLPELPYQSLFDPGFAAAGITAVIALALLLEKTGFGRAIQFLGRYSLEIYLVHTIAAAGVRIALANVMHVSDPAAHLVLGTSAGIYGPIALVLFLNWIGFHFAFKLSKGVGAKPHEART